MTRVENRWTVGNVAALAGVAVSSVLQVTAIIWWAASVSSDLAVVSDNLDRQQADVDKRLEAQSIEARRQNDIHGATFSNYDIRLRDVERGYTRLDEKTSMILETVREVRDTLKTHPNTK